MTGGKLTCKGNKPPVIQGRIEVVELSMGKQVSHLSSGTGYVPVVRSRQGRQTDI